MTRLPTSLSLLSAAALLAAGAQAQCFTPSGTSVTGSLQLIDPGYNFPDDEGYTPPAPLGFTFPATSMVGAAAITLDHFVATTNGELLLTDSVGTGYSPLFEGVNSLAKLRGTPGECPRILPWSYDMADVGPGTWDMKVDQVAGVSTTVTWQNAGYWNSATEEISFSVTVDVNGTVKMSYAPTGWAGVPSSVGAFVGISSGNGVGTIASPGVDLSTGTATSSIGLIYQSFPAGGSGDLAGFDILFVPNGTGGWIETLLDCAFHQSYGNGCYTIAREAFYQLFPDTTSSNAALAGNSLNFAPVGAGYNVTLGGGVFRTPVTPNVLALTDDSEADVTPSTPFPHVGGPVATLSVNSNGTVNMGPVGNNEVDIYANTTALLSDPLAAFRSNRDYNPGAGGTVSWEEAASGADTVLYITFNGVFIYGTSSPETFQFQLTLAGPNAGNAQIVWTTMSTSSLADLVVGYAPGGGSIPPGSIVLASALPITTQPDVKPLTLTASPRPVITLGGTGPAALCTYTVSNVPEFDPINFPGVGAGALLWGLPGSQVPGGFDLGTFPSDIGMPGCSGYVFPIAAQVDISGVIAGGPGGTLSFSIAMPQPLTPGLEFYLQAIALLPAGTPATGSNNLVGTPYGARTSNGLIIHYENQ
ncbi:MAG: hypothetical protein JNM25_05955 [Planctomycetes bacterium]|nr:hypothetical protein [Planctomycetota bacterium]